MAGNWQQRILRIEPGVSLGQWVYDRITNNWASLLTLIGASGMSFLAAITEWTRAYGPFGIAAIGVFFALLIWFVAVWARKALAAAAVYRAERAAIDGWKTNIDSINPLATDFHTQRIRIIDLVHPITKRVANKRFVECELVGPANILFEANMELSGVAFANCDTVVVRNAEAVHLYNVYAFNNVKIFGGMIGNCTLYIPQMLVPQFDSMGAEFLTFTGLPEYDSQTPLGAAPEKRPQTRPG